MMGAADRTTIFGRLLARWEVSYLAVMPNSFTMLSIPPVWLGVWWLGEMHHRLGSSIRLIVLTVWLAVMLLEHARVAWCLRHPCASPAWLRNLRAAVGDAVTDDALRRLAVQHALAPDYTIRRYDMAVAIWVGRTARREARQRAEGLRLDQILPKP